jgi:hypothetical protein
MKIQVNYPGFWAHGRTYEAERQTLQIRPGGNLQGGQKKAQWAATPTHDPAIFEVECFIVNDPEFGEFAVPITRAKALAEAA